MMTVLLLLVCIILAPFALSALWALRGLLLILALLLGIWFVWMMNDWSARQHNQAMQAVPAPSGSVVDPVAAKAHGKAQLEIDAQRQHEFNAQWLAEAQAATQRWNESQR